MKKFTNTLIVMMTIAFTVAFDALITDAIWVATENYHSCLGIEVFGIIIVMAAFAYYAWERVCYEDRG